MVGRLVSIRKTHKKRGPTVNSPAKSWSPKAASLSPSLCQKVMTIEVPQRATNDVMGVYPIKSMKLQKFRATQNMWLIATGQSDESTGPENEFLSLRDKTVPLKLAGRLATNLIHVGISYVSYVQMFGVLKCCFPHVRLSPIAFWGLSPSRTH